MRNEDALQKEVAKYLKDHMPSACWWTATANGAVLAGTKKQRMMQSNKLKAMGVKNGTPDLIVCYDSRFFGIELKLPKTADQAKTYQTKDQKAVEDQIGIAGGGYAVCRTVDEVAQQLIAWGMPMKDTLRRRLLASLIEEE